MGKKITPTIEAGLFLAITIILGLITIYVPLVGILVEFFYAVPLAIITTRQGTGRGLSVLFLSFLCIAMLVSPVQAIRLTLSFGICGIVLGWCIRKNFSAIRIFFTVMGASFASQVFTLIFLIVVIDVNLIDAQIEMFRESFANSLAMYESMGVDQQQINEAKAQVEPTLQTLTLLMPTIIVLNTLINTATIWLIAHWIFPKLQLKIPTLPRFAEWRFPALFTYTAIIGGLGLYWGVTRGWTEIQEISLNLMIVSILIGMLQGFALLSAVFDRYKISKLVRRILYVIFILNLFLLQLVAITGLIVMIFDYRKKFFKD